ncbi:MAG: hypothetical protein VW771_11900, partial [Gammaproteobacteria bacterium]
MSEYLKTFLSALAQVSRLSDIEAFRSLAPLIAAVPNDRRPPPSSGCATSNMCLEDAVRAIPPHLQLADAGKAAARVSP